MTEPPAARGTFEKHHPFHGTFHSPLCTFYRRTTASIRHQSTMYPVLDNTETCSPSGFAGQEQIRQLNSGV